MPLATILRTLKTRLDHQQPRRTGHWAAARQRATAKPRLERLEERLALAGFGPEDGAYIVEPWQGHYWGVEIQPSDQKIVAAGLWATEDRIAVARYDAFGNMDSSYGTGGVANPALGPTSESALSLVLQPDGKAVMAGYAGSPGVLGVARLNTNGSPDTSFGNGGWNSFDVHPGSSHAYGWGVGLQSTGKIVVSGNASSAFVARFKTSGAIDSGKGGFGQVVRGKATGATLSPNNGHADLAIQLDDKLVAAGTVNDGNLSWITAARYTPLGALDTTFSGDGYASFAPTAAMGFTSASAKGVALQADGKIVTAGQSFGSTDGLGADMLITRFHANGTLDTGFGGGAGYVRLDIDGAATLSSEIGNDLVIQSDGKIVVVGETFVYNQPGPQSVLVARFNPDGTPDTTFAPGGFKLSAPAPETGYNDSHANAVTLQSDGSIIVAGWTQPPPGGEHHPLLMRFYGSPPSPLVAAGGAATASADAESPTLAQVQPLLNEAIARWEASGADVSGLGSLDVRIADLDDATLGPASANTIWLDVNAAGWGWFVDPTPEEDSEFTLPGNQGEQDRMDLLTVLMHELGHLLGRDHDDEGMMADTLAAGTRHASAESDESAAVDQVFALAADGEALSWLAFWDAEGGALGPRSARCQ